MSELTKLYRIAKADDPPEMHVGRRCSGKDSVTEYEVTEVEEDEYGEWHAYGTPVDPVDGGYGEGTVGPGDEGATDSIPTGTGDSDADGTGEGTEGDVRAITSSDAGRAHDGRGH